MGIEPTAQAWEAWVLPLYDAREGRHSTLLQSLTTSHANDCFSFSSSGLTMTSGRTRLSPRRVANSATEVEIALTELQYRQGRYQPLLKLQRKTIINGWLFEVN